MARLTYARIACLGLAAVVLGGASSGSCIPSLFSLGKNSLATDPSDAPSGGDFATLSQCASFATYRASADPVFQRMCLSCHASGGRGAGTLVFSQTSGEDDNKIATNFSVSLTKLLTDDSGNYDSNPLLARLNGTISHDITLDIAGDDYAALRQWVGEERLAPCGSAVTATPTE